TREAQNALLKMLEDPSPRTHFFLVTPHPELLLPTLRSRFAALEVEKAVDLTAAARFLAASYAERAVIAGELIENASRSAAEGLVRGIVVLLHQRGADPDLLSHIERLRRYSTDPASSLKMILDCCMYSIPA
ncbi:MAG TPA: hypothetical protein VJ837_02870, partial [Candidatus Paceibacterota bacterium]|nr:hypothetical protein [Candidatus Paceibacterota bacterium]